jgi:hypothetical protein
MQKAAQATDTKKDESVRDAEVAEEKKDEGTL